MAETAVFFVLEQVYQFLKEQGKQLKHVHKEFEAIKTELQGIRAFLKDADTKASDEGDTNEAIKDWVKQLREESFHIEDVIDEYTIYVAQRTHHSPFIASLQKVANLIRTSKSRNRMASEIQDIKSTVHEINERGKTYNLQPCFVHGSSSTVGNRNGSWVDPRLASLFIDDAEIVGFEHPRKQLLGWLVNGATSRTVISVVGMGGLGKTTLAKTVSNNQKVKGHFDCHAFVTVSQSYAVDALLREMMRQFCAEKEEPVPQGLYSMDRTSLITVLRNYLKEKRYVVFFDDVWKADFWDEIKLATIDSNIGSRVVITTRNSDVAYFCKKDSNVRVHELQPLPPNKAWELFCKKVFQYEFNGTCPLDLQDISDEIVRKCDGLPLAIVAIAGLLSTKDKTVSEWKEVRQNLSFELDRNPHLTSLRRILALSYEDLPFNLKTCFLYFGMYPEDYSIRSAKLIRQWMAEGFIEYVEKKTSEDVAEQYLSELINRTLVQPSYVQYDGRVKSCRVHDSVRDMIIWKMKDLNFCRVVEKVDFPLPISGITRRLAVATSSDAVLRSIEYSRLRSIFVFEASKLSKYVMSWISQRSKLLKVLDFEGASLDYVPDDLGNLFHLRFLSLRNTKVKSLPKSIGKLQNLETLDMKQTLVHDLPSEINKLIKLRHLLVCSRTTFSSIHSEIGVQMKKGIGSLICLQKLYHVEADHGGLDLIRELRKLRQLRRLGLKNVKREYGNALSDSIKEMNCLQSLHISATSEDEIINLQHISSPSQLQRLHLFGRLEKLPEWVPMLKSLVRLSLRFSKLSDDPLKKLKDLPELLRLVIASDSYDGEALHFEAGFLKLKRLYLIKLSHLNSVVVDKGALPSVERVQMMRMPKLKEMPSGIHLMKRLQALYVTDMPEEFKKSIDPNEGHRYWTIKHVPIIHIIDRNRPNSHNRTIRHTEVSNAVKSE